MSKNNSNVKAHPVIRHAANKIKKRIQEVMIQDSEFDLKIDKAILESKQNLQMLVYKDELL